MLARQIAIGFGIAVIFPLLVYYAVATFHPPPKTADYFRARPPPSATATAEERSGFAERQRQEREAFDVAAKAFARVLVLAAAPLGLAAILAGAFLSVHAIGTGLIVGGIASVAFGYFGYWQYLDNWVRFASLLAGFALLLLIGLRRATVRPAEPQS